MASSKLGEAYIQLELRNQKFNQALTTTQNKTQSVIGKMGAAFKSLGPIIAAAFSVAAITKFVAASNVQERAVTNLNAALRLTGQFSERTSREMQEFASSLQRITTEGDEATLANMSLLLTIGRLGKEDLPAATKASIGLAKAIGANVTTGFTLMARAAQGDTAQLAKYGIKIDELLSPQEKFNELLRFGADAFKLAEAEARDGAGALTQFSNTAGDLEESLGSLVKLALVPMAKTLQPVIEGITAMVEKFIVAVTVQGKLDAAIQGLEDGYFKVGKEALEAKEAIAGADTLRALREVAQTYKLAGENIDFLRERFAALGGRKIAFAQPGAAPVISLPEIEGAPMGADIDIAELQSAQDDRIEIFREALNEEERLRQQTDDLAAAHARIDRLREEEKTAYLKEQVELRAQMELDTRRNVIGAINRMEAAGLAKNRGIMAIFKAIKIAEAIMNTHTAMGQALAATNISLPRKIANVAAVAALGFSNVASIKGVRAFAQGGIVMGPTAALIGEAGPEAVVPLKDGGKIPIEGGGSTIYNDFRGALVDPVQIMAMQRAVAVDAVIQNVESDGVLRDLMVTRR